MRYFLVIALAACASEPTFDTDAEELASENGVSLNGVSLNGVSLNGVSLNGLEPALATSTVSSWFNTDVVNHEVEMRYVVKCMRPSTSTVTWKNPVGGATYSWQGLLNLAPSWGSRALTVEEQQVLTACLLAHANKYGVHVPVAVEGRAAGGTEIPRDANELTTYSSKEAAFFGNTQNGEGAFVCLDHATWDASRSTARACAFDTSASGKSTVCPPLLQVGQCGTYCTQDATKTYYTSCTYNGKTYHPLTTRLRPQDIYKCGDGICQFTEHCGNGATWNNCRADCGLCP